MREEAHQVAVITLLLRRFTWRHWRLHWRPTLLLVAILALGVGVFLSIRLANRAAVSGFDLFTDSIAGESDFTIRPTAGSALPISTLREVREALGPLPVAIFPILEATVSEKSEDLASARSWQLVGLDLVALRNASAFGGGNPPAARGNGDSNFTLGSPRHGWVASTWATRSALGIGDEIELVVNDQVTSIEIAGLLENDPLRPKVPENLVLMDLPGAQRLLEKSGWVSRVELVVPAGAMAGDVRSEIASRLEGRSPGWQLEGDDERRNSVGKMTYAFRLNLTVLSTLALLVGTYLILQALEAAVVRRRGEIAVMRSLGVDGSTIRTLWVVESLMLGAVGSGLGILLGWGMAQLTVGAIAQTVNGLYYATTTEAASLHAGEVIFAVTFGLLASLVAGWLPARDAASTPPAQALRSGNRAEGLRILKDSRIGLLAGGIAFVLGWLPPLTTGEGNRVPLGGYLAAFFWVISFSILAGWLFRPVSKIARTLFQGRIEVRYAMSHFRRPLGRHRLAVAGLIAAIGMASGMGILVHSFEGTLTGWIGQLLKADLYVATAGAANASNANTIRKETWQAIADDRSVEGVDVIRRYSVDYEGRRIRLAGSEYHRESTRRLSLSWLSEPDNPDPHALAILREGGLVPGWINEAFARRFQINRGDVIALPTPAGAKSIQIEGVYTDYSDEAGTVLINRLFTSAWFADDTVSNMAAYLHSGEVLEEVQGRWAREFPALVVRQNARLRGEALRVFHQTFAVTYALEIIGVVVAVAGLGMALASLLVERREEMTTLKAIGFTRSQIARASAVEGTTLGGIGFLGGLALSLILGALLIFVINRQSFGWTLDYRVPWGLLSILGGLTLATSALVSSLVGYRGSRLRGDPEE